MSTYIALTIGPVYTTINQAKKTRAVWAGSYFFSWFIKEVLKGAQANEFTILLPFSATISQTQNGTGKYADRLYFEKGGKNTEDVRILVNNVINKIALDIDKLCVAESVEKVEEFLSQYLNVHIVEADIVNEAEVLFTLNQLLDQKELTQYFVSQVQKNYLQEYIGLEVSKGSLLATDAFGDTKGWGFRSVPETAATSLQRMQPEPFRKIVTATYNNEDLEIIDALGNSTAFKELIRPHHKYMAVVYADGDNIGDLLKKISADGTALREFSRLLLDFADKAEEVISNYGGDSIYLGGEDILAFLPIACITNDQKEQQTLFHVIAALDGVFKETIGDYAVSKGVKAPTLSYGISINYVKHPLKESMHIAHDLLGQCKDKKRTPAKNAIGIRLHKHSGQYMECIIEKDKEKSWEMVKAIVYEYTKKTLPEKTEELLSGVIHRFKDNMFFEVFAEALRNNRAEAFFTNYFDEDIHKEDDKEKFLKAVRLFSVALFEEYTDNAACKNILFTVLRFIHFINSKRD